MSEFIIKAEGVGKKFLIGHQTAERHMTFRESLVRGTRIWLKQTNDWIRAHRLTGNDQIEEFWALRDITFEVKQGDRLGIIGQNGAGKSTLLKILSRITEPTQGRISIRGRVASLLEVGTGFHPELSGRENIFLNGAILGMSRAEIKAKFDEIVTFAEVERFLDTPVKRYSSGMYVRLAFAVAAHLEPEILIIDEVLAVGDKKFQDKCLGKMEDISRNEGRTLLFVSHNIGVLTQLCNKAILLKSGSIKVIGSTESVVDSYIKDSESIDNEYRISTQNSAKLIYISLINSCDEGGKKANEFKFNQSFGLYFEFFNLNKVPGLLLGIGLNDKLNNRIFTVIKEVDYFETSDSGFYKGHVVFPSEIFSPSLYKFSLALWTRDGIVYDHLENISPIKIHELGSGMAIYEGLNYGSIIINPTWVNYQ